MVGGGGGTEGYLKTQQYTPWKVQEDDPGLHIGRVNLYSPSWRNPLALGEAVREAWCVAALVTSLLSDSSLLRLMNG